MASGRRIRSSPRSGPSSVARWPAGRWWALPAPGCTSGSGGATSTSTRRRCGGRPSGADAWASSRSTAVSRRVAGRSTNGQGSRQRRRPRRHRGPHRGPRGAAGTGREGGRVRPWPSRGRGVGAAGFCGEGRDVRAGPLSRSTARWSWGSLAAVATLDSRLTVRWADVQTSARIHPRSSVPQRCPDATAPGFAQPWVRRGSMPEPVVTMKQLLDAGVHFGHQTRRWR